MTRTGFLLPALAFVAAAPLLGAGRKHFMTTESILAELHEKRAHAASLTVRHIGAFVSTRTRIHIEQLAALKAVGETHDAHAIGHAFDAIENAEPSATPDSSEPRWHLTFADRAGTPTLVVTTAAFAPRHGTIGGASVVFANDRLVRWLAEHYAPGELPAMHG